MMNRRSFLGLLSFSVPAYGLAQQRRDLGLRLYFVRHAETVANASGKYNSQTIDRLSTRGEQQVARLTGELLAMSLDTICVSPMRRAIETVRPYLERTKAVAELWPELAECCHQKVRGSQPSPKLPRGPEIAVANELRSSLRIDPTDRHTYEPANYADGIALVRRAAERIRRELSGSGRTVLLVGHSLAGSRLIEMLLGWEPRGRFTIANAEISHLNQVEDGTFELVELNGKVSAFKFQTAPPK